MRTVKAKANTPRTVDDPRVRRVIRAIDRLATSPHVDELLLGVVESLLLTFGNCTHSYHERDGWTSQQRARPRSRLR
jgi:hypothetical protein